MRERFNRITRIYRKESRKIEAYQDFLDNLKPGDVVLFFVPSWRTISLKTLKTLDKKKIRAYFHSLVHQVNLMLHDCMGVFSHAEWVLGRLLSDSILWKIYASGNKKAFSTYAGPKFAEVVGDKKLDEKDFNQALAEHLKSGGGLGPGMKYKYLSHSGIDDPIITAGLLAYDGKFVPTIKAFDGNASRTVVSGSSEKVINLQKDVSLVDEFIKLCCEFRPIGLCGVFDVAKSRPTPAFMWSPKKFFKESSSACVSRTLACFYEALESLKSDEEEKKDVWKKEIWRLTNGFQLPIPRQAFFDFFADAFDTSHQV